MQYGLKFSFYVHCNVFSQPSRQPLLAQAGRFFFQPNQIYSFLFCSDVKPYELEWIMLGYSWIITSDLFWFHLDGPKTCHAQATDRIRPRPTQ